jgi:protein gp37
MKPLAWNRAAEASGVRPRVFCASLSDWLDDEVPIEWLADLLALIQATPNLDWLLLTKRPSNWKPRMEAANYECVDRHAENGEKYQLNPSAWINKWYCGEAPHNVWIGSSVEDQQRADERIPALLKIPARIHFLSMEPLLGPVDIEQYLLSDYDKAAHDDQLLEPITGFDRRKIDWVIVGGESGSCARPMQPDWVRDIRDQCEQWSAPFLFKQWGGADKKAAGRLLDGRTWDEVPSANVQEEPRLE